LPKRAVARVKPTHQSVQIVSGSGLASGSRLPATPVASRKPRNRKDSRLVAIGLGGRSANMGSRAWASRSEMPFGRKASTRKLAATASVPPTR
jgi:hypothetical protein